MRSALLIGTPNCGKTSLFNLLTGAQEKVGNYTGVTVMSAEGIWDLGSTKVLLQDLPGIYSLEPSELPDERVTQAKLKEPLDTIIFVADGSDMQTLQRSFALWSTIESSLTDPYKALCVITMRDSTHLSLPEFSMPTAWISTRDFHARALLAEKFLSLPDHTPSSLIILPKNATPDAITQRIDRIVLHPIAGPFILFCMLGLLFQFLFSLARIPMDAIEFMVAHLGTSLNAYLPPGSLQSLITQGILPGVGAVLVFLPQILILFFFLLLLEDIGYLPRATFLVDQLMLRTFGLSGRSLIPFLASFACAIPGILATRTMNKRDRLITMLAIPWIGCSARLPVYVVLISALVPGSSSLKGLLLLLLCLFGLMMAALVSTTLGRLLPPSDSSLLLELPTYKIPHMRSLFRALGLKAWLFISHTGSIIFFISVAIWFLASHPQGLATSYAAQFGKFLEPVFLPIGFDWKIIAALIPSFAAREAMIGALATMISFDAETPHLTALFPFKTACSLLIWFALSCQCFATLSVIAKETQSWRWPITIFCAMTLCAYFGSFLTYQGLGLLGF